jgi:hypothetical protein
MLLPQGLEMLRGEQGACKGHKGLPGPADLGGLEGKLRRQYTRLIKQLQVRLLCAHPIDGCRPCSPAILV